MGQNLFIKYSEKKIAILFALMNKVHLLDSTNRKHSKYHPKKRETFETYNKKESKITMENNNLIPFPLILHFNQCRKMFQTEITSPTRTSQ
jgi:hypothetical protein